MFGWKMWLNCHAGLAAKGRPSADGIAWATILGETRCTWGAGIAQAATRSILGKSGAVMRERFGICVAAILVFGSPAGSFAAPKSGTAFRDCPNCPEMIVVPPGKFAMGFDGGEPDRYEGPVRQLTIARPFAVGKFEVTNGEYAVFAAATHRPSTDNCNLADIPIPGATWRDPHYGRPIRDNEPVVCITWHDAKAYVAWLSIITGKTYRLPSEAEWEYVARAGTTTAYPWGESPNGACTTANVHDQTAARANQRSIKGADCDDGFAEVAAVGSLQPNALGLYDVIGNVWEWTEDCYAVPYPPQPVDGSAYEVNGTCDRRAVRGGSWLTIPFRQRPSWRGRDSEDRITQIFGMRVARDLID